MYDRRSVPLPEKREKQQTLLLDLILSATKHKRSKSTEGLIETRIEGLATMSGRDRRLRGQRALRHAASVRRGPRDAAPGFPQLPPPSVGDFPRRDPRRPAPRPGLQDGNVAVDFRPVSLRDAFRDPHDVPHFLLLQLRVRVEHAAVELSVESQHVHPHLRKDGKQVGRRPRWRVPRRRTPGQASQTGLRDPPRPPSPHGIARVSDARACVCVFCRR